MLYTQAFLIKVANTSIRYCGEYHMVSADNSSVPRGNLVSIRELWGSLRPQGLKVARAGSQNEQISLCLVYTYLLEQCIDYILMAGFSKSSMMWSYVLILCCRAKGSLVLASFPRESHCIGCLSTAISRALRFTG